MRSEGKAGGADGGCGAISTFTLSDRGRHCRLLGGK